MTDEVNVSELKAQVYDLMLMRENVNQRIQNLNQAITEATKSEQLKQPKPKEESKSK